MTELNTEQTEAIGNEPGDSTDSPPVASVPMPQDYYDHIQALAQGGAEWVDAATIADLMGVSIWTIYRALKRKEIPHVYVGRQIRINRHAFIEAMRRQMEEAIDHEG